MICVDPQRSHWGQVPELKCSCDGCGQKLTRDVMSEPVLQRGFLGTLGPIMFVQSYRCKECLGESGTGSTRWLVTDPAILTQLPAEIRWSIPFLHTRKSIISVQQVSLMSLLTMHGFSFHAQEEVSHELAQCDRLDREVLFLAVVDTARATLLPIPASPSVMLLSPAFVMSVELIQDLVVPGAGRYAVPVVPLASPAPVAGPVMHMGSSSASAPSSSISKKVCIEPTCTAKSGRYEAPVTCLFHLWFTECVEISASTYGVARLRLPAGGERKENMLEAAKRVWPSVPERVMQVGSLLFEQQVASAGDAAFAAAFV